MAAEVGKLNEAALSRKRKLEELRSRKENIKSDSGGDKPSGEKAPIFRSYKPKDDSSLRELAIENGIPGEVSDQIRDELSRENEGVILDSLDFANLAPRKPDWDLKRDIAPKLDKLERRTQIAIAELIRERLAEEDLANAVAAGAAAAQRGSRD